MLQETTSSTSGCILDGHQLLFGEEGIRREQKAIQRKPAHKVRRWEYRTQEKYHFSPSVDTKSPGPWRSLVSKQFHVSEKQYFCSMIRSFSYHDI